MPRPLNFLACRFSVLMSLVGVSILLAATWCWASCDTKKVTVHGRESVEFHKFRLHKNVAEKKAVLHT